MRNTAGYIMRAQEWRKGGGGGLYLWYVGPKGYGFSALLVINKVSILAMLIIITVWLCGLVLNRVMFFF